MSVTRYLPEITELMVCLQARSAYVFVVEGTKGTGGSPIIQLQPTYAEYVARCRELLSYMKRSVELFEADIRKMEGAPGGT